MTKEQYIRFNMIVNKIVYILDNADFNKVKGYMIKITDKHKKSVFLIFSKKRNYKRVRGRFIYELNKQKLDFDNEVGITFKKIEKKDITKIKRRERRRG